MKRAPLLMAAGCLLLASSWAADIPSRDELKRERQTIEADFAKRAEECRGQFVVTPCLDKVRQDKQKALSQVAAHEHAHDAADRQARAEARNKRVADKAGAAASTAATSAPASAPASAAAPTKNPPKPKDPRPKAATKQDRQAQEQASRAAYDARQREIEAHRQMVEKRNAERARSKTPPRPLPPPASAGS